MNKTLVIYSSKYGHTKKYAEWLAEDLSADICDDKNLKKEMLTTIPSYFSEVVCLREKIRQPF